MKNEKQVRQLQVGDVLSSGAVIVERPYDSIKCPKGKLNIGVDYGDGVKKIVQWGRNTTVGIKSKE